MAERVFTATVPDIYGFHDGGRPIGGVAAGFIPGRELLGFTNADFLAVLQAAPHLKNTDYGIGCSFVDETTQQFITEAMASGAHRRARQLFSPEEWDKTVTVVRAYQETDLYFREIAPLVYVGRTRAQKMYKAFLTRLHESSDDETKGKYPLSSLKIRKITERYKNDSSRLRHAGQRQEALELIVEYRRNGAETSDYSILVDGLGVTPMRARNLLYSLRRDGLIPESVIVSNKALLQRARALRVGYLPDRETMQMDATSRMECSMILKDAGEVFMQKHDDLFATVYDLVKSAGFKVRGPSLGLFIDVLKMFRIPFKAVPHEKDGKIYHTYYVLRAETSAIVAALLEDPTTVKLKI